MNKIILALMLITGMAFAAPTSPDYCQLKVNGQVLWSGIGQDENGQGFFAFASQYSNSANTCVHAKIDRVANSGRVYDNGKLVPSYSGKKKGLSNAEASEAKQRAGGGCMVLSCIAVVDYDHPQYEQPVQAPSYPTVEVGGGY